MEIMKSIYLISQIKPTIFPGILVENDSKMWVCLELFRLGSTFQHKG